MKIAVIGAGIVGVATAFELAQDGHEVTVLERRSGDAAEGSFAPAGLSGTSGIGPWAALGVMPGALMGLGARNPGRWAFAPAAWSWRWRFRRAARAATGHSIDPSLNRLAQYSRERADALRGRFKMEFERTRGVLLLLRSQAELEQARAGLERLREAGATARLLDAVACLAIEPGLNRESPLAGGLHLPDDESGNCRQFAHLLRDGAERAGVDFRFGSIVRALDAAAAGDGVELRVEQLALTTGFAPSRVVMPQSPGVPSPLARRVRAAARYLDPVSTEHYDAVVIAGGAASSAWLPALGLSVPLVAVHGYSLTAALRAPERGPQSALVDPVRQAVVTRLGQRVRVAGGSELGLSTEPRRAAVEALYAVLNDWFPGCAHLARPQVWKGARAMMAGQLPLVGPSPRRGVWLNLGHGNAGWALACGSARMLADQIAGRTPALDAVPFAAGRFARA